MIIRDIIDEKYIYTYSDLSVMIRQLETGNVYESAYDPIELSSSRTYEETDEKIIYELEE